ncbi:MAG TPA: hypothetical protein VFO00_11455 [Vitreimonas sp.]|nr:hypothetical protein [Vitreimonas sp.]
MRSSTSNSDPVDGAATPVAEDQQSDYWRRSTPPRSWAAIALVAFLTTAALTAGWEAYWRANWQVAGDYKDTNALWADQRRRASGDATVIIGSSRALFGLDLETWESAGRGRPVQLAMVGTSPRIFLSDLAADETFTGLLIVDVMSPAFFGSTGGRRESALAYARNQTPSERVDHLLSMQLEGAFAFIDEQTRPRRMLFLAKFPLRPGMTERLDPHKLFVSAADRNSQMWGRVLEDEEYREEAKSIWARLRPPGRRRDLTDADISAVISEVRRDAERIRARGGEVVFIRMPYEGAYTQIEDRGFPRQRFWDRLVAETGSVGVTWHDHPELQGYELPEWSHLAPHERERFTRALTRILYARLDEQRGASDGASAR